MNFDLRFRSRLVELLFDYKIKGSSKHFVDVMYSITRYKRKVFAYPLLSPCNNKWVNASSFMDRRFGLTILTFYRRDCFSFFKFEQWRRQCLVDSVALPQL